MRKHLIVLVVVSMSVALAPAQSAPQSSDGSRPVPMQMVVTAEQLRGGKVPPIDRGDVMALIGKTSPVVTEWVSLQGEMAALELYVLVDERVDPTATGRFEELRRFTESQAPTTAVGVAYMSDGEAHIIQPPTRGPRTSGEGSPPDDGRRQRRCQSVHVVEFANQLLAVGGSATRSRPDLRWRGRV